MAPRPAPARPQAAVADAAPAPIRKIRSAAVILLLICLACALAYGATLLPRPQFTTFDINAYREKIARRPAGESVRSMIAREIGADALTMTGVAGWVDYEPASGNLVMSIKDRRGNPVADAYVRAVIRESAGQDAGQDFLLLPDGESRYKADMRTFDRGSYDLSITAVDPKVRTGTGLIFRIEKTIKVD